jgi:hypothetical protein
VNTSTKQSRLAQRAALAIVVSTALGLSACGSGAKSTDAVTPTTAAPAVETAAPSSVVAAETVVTETVAAGTDAPAAETVAAAVETAAAADSVGSVATETAAAGDTGAAQSSDTKPAATKAAKAAAATTASNANVDANAIPKLKGEVGALADVTVKDCVKDGADWTAKGSLTNSSKASAAYVITTSFLDDKGATLGLGWSKIDSVKAGGSQEWSVKAPAAGDKLQCIMRVTRGAA